MDKKSNGSNGVHAENDDVRSIRGPREKLYDEEIDPVVNQLIDLCSRHGIPVVVGVELDYTRAGTQMVCVSVHVDNTQMRSSGTVERAAELMMPGVTK